MFDFFQHSMDLGMSSIFCNDIIEIINFILEKRSPDEEMLEKLA